MKIEDALRHAAHQISRDNLALADFVCRSILSLMPGHAAALNLVGVIAARLGLRDEAIAYFAKSLAHDPAFGPAKDNLRKIQKMPIVSGRPTGRRYLLIKAWGYGFWSDVNHVLGSLLLAEITGRTPVTHWGTNSLFGDGSTRDAFQLYFAPVSPETLYGLLALNEASFFPPKWSAADLIKEDHSKWHGSYSRMAGINFLGRSEVIAISDFYIGVIDLLPWIPEAHKLHGKSVDDVYLYLAEKYLKPRDHILSEVEAFYSRRISKRSTVAVHIRGSDKKLEIRNIEDLNRHCIDVIDQQNPACQIFLLTDDMRWVSIFRDRYADRLVVTDSQRTSNDVVQDPSGTLHGGSDVNSPSMVLPTMAMPVFAVSGGKWVSIPCNLFS